MPKRKVTLYFNDEMLAETEREAVRQDRSISWIIQAAWRIARSELRSLPAVEVEVELERDDPAEADQAPPQPTRQRAAGG